MLKDTFHKNLGNAYKMQIEEIGFLMSVYGVAVRLAVFPIQFLGVQPLDELILIGVKTGGLTHGVIEHTVVLIIP